MNWKWRSPIDYLYWVTELKWNKMCALWTYSKFNHRPLFLHYLSQVYSVIFHYPRKIIFKNTKIISTCAIRIFWNKQKLTFTSVQSLSRVWLLATPWIAAHQASLSVTNSQSSLRLTSIKSVMPSSHLILGRPLLLLLPIPPSIRVFSSESTLRMRWPNYWSFSFSISPFKEHPGLIFRMD